jgi:hypothetical protein
MCRVCGFLLGAAFGRLWDESARCHEARPMGMPGEQALQLFSCRARLCFLLQ